MVSATIDSWFDALIKSSKAKARRQKDIYKQIEDGESAEDGADCNVKED
jgi:hypothetical protein